MSLLRADILRLQRADKLSLQSPDIVNGLTGGGGSHKDLLGNLLPLFKFNQNF